VTFPLGFLLGLAVMMLAHVLIAPLPGEGDVWHLLLWSWVLLLPVLLVGVADRVLRQRRARGQAIGVLPLLLLRLCAGSSPAAYFVLLSAGTLTALADQDSNGSEAQRLLLLLAPLLLLEILRITAEAPLRALLRATGLGAGAPAARDRIGMLAILSLPLLLFGVGLDLAALDRRLEVFLTGTSLGATLGLGAFLLLLSVLLPLSFRFFLATTRALPGHLEQDLRATAQQLGFPPQCVLAMDTGLRLVNAMMVGPLPWPRYLVLTDGLLTVLDPLALRGVVAHEVGHARAGHPGLLMVVFVVVPLLLLQMLQQLDVESLQGAWMATAALAATGLVLVVLRSLAHRFEYEADVLSAEALGGAAPCVQALQKVGDLPAREDGHGRGTRLWQRLERLGRRHPPEQERVRTLLRWELEPGFRASFHVAGRRLRTLVVAVVLFALGGASWAWWSAWPVERAVWLFYTGDFVAAKAQIQAASGAVRGGLWDWWQRFQEDADAAFAIAPRGGDWALLRPVLADAGWRRGIEVLQRDGPTAARPYFSLATEDAERSPLRRSLELYCTAARDQDQARMAQLRAHIAAMALPPELRRLFTQ